MIDVVELSNRCFGPQQTVLQVGGVDVASIAEIYGTPLFVYDRCSLDRRLDQLQATCPVEFYIYYSVKANANLAILSHFVTRGCGLEVASAGELMQALATGCEPQRIIFAGPGKTNTELELSIVQNIGEIHIESHSEATRVARISKALNVRARVGLRINPAAEAQGGAMRMGGKAAPFGIDEEEIEPVVDYLSSEASIDFCGVHLSPGTQVLDWQVLATQYRKAIAVGRKVAQRTRRPLQTLNLGGGLGIPYFQGDRALDLVAFASDLEALMRDVRTDPCFQGTRFLIEPGRYLVGEAGIYLTRVVDIKQSRGKKFLILDGGMNHHLAASGNLGQTIKRNYPLMLPEKLRSPNEEIVDVVGPLCTPLDTLGRRVALPKAQIGDLLAILQSGAYTRSASPLGFLSHPSPPEVWIDNGQHFLIRSRGQLGDGMRDVCLPPSLRPSCAV